MTDTEGAGARRLIDMKREVLVAGVTLVLLSTILHIVFGPFWAKRGIFLKGIGSQSEYCQALREHQGWATAQSQSRSIRLAANGSGRMQVETSFRHMGESPQARFTWSGPPGEGIRILDEERNELAVESRKQGAGYLWLVELPKDARRGEVFVIRQDVVEIGDMAREANGLWVYNMRHVFGSEIRLVDLVALPAWAELVSAEPKPTQTHETNGSLVLRFERKLQEMQAFECTIRYRLRPPAASGKRSQLAVTRAGASAIK